MSQSDLCNELLYTEKLWISQTIFTLLWFAAMDTCVMSLKDIFQDLSFGHIFLLQME